MVEGIVGFGAELQAVTFPYERESLRNAEVYVGEVRSVQDISVTSLLPADKGKSGKRLLRIGKKLDLIVICRVVVDASLDCFRIPIEQGSRTAGKARGASPAADGIHGKPRAPGDHTGNLPSANDLVKPARNIVGNRLTPSNRQRVEYRRVDLVLGVEFGVAAAGIGIVRIAKNGSCAIHKVSIVVRNDRAVVDGMGERVIKIELQVARELLSQGGEHRVVGRVALVCAQGVHKELRTQPDVGWGQPKNGLSNGAQIALHQSSLVQGVDTLRASRESSG